MSSHPSFHTPIPSKKSISDSSISSSETKKSSPSSSDDINTLIDEHIEEAKVSCPVVLIKNFSDKYPTIDADTLFSEHSQVRLAITSEDTLIIKDMPSPPHEVANRFFERKFGRINSILSNGDEDSPILSFGSTTIRYGRFNRYEADSSYRNKFAPEYFDNQGRLIPGINIEIGYSESIGSLFTTANAYLQNSHVNMVISVKIVGRNDKAEELISFVHKRSVAEIFMEPPISFGRPLSDSTRATLASLINMEELIEVPEQGHSVIDGEDLYSIVIPRNILWMEAEHAQPVNAGDHRIYLYDMLRVLRNHKCLDEGIVIPN
jgi:hypothetical protein